MIRLICEATEVGAALVALDEVGQARDRFAEPMQLLDELTGVVAAAATVADVVAGVSQVLLAAAVTDFVEYWLLGAESVGVAHCEGAWYDQTNPAFHEFAALRRRLAAHGPSAVTGTADRSDQSAYLMQLASSPGTGLAQQAAGAGFTCVCFVPVAHAMGQQHLLGLWLRDARRATELERVGAHLCALSDETGRRVDPAAFGWVRPVIEDSPCVLFRLRPDPGRSVAYISENVSRFGYAAADLIGRRVDSQQWVHPDDRKRVAQALAQSQAGDLCQQEYRVLSRSGEVRWVDDRTRIVRDAQGSIVAYHGILIDITRHKQTELALQEQQRLYQIVAENASDVVAIHDCDGVCQYMSPSAETVFGYPPQALLGKNPNLLIHAEDMARWRSALVSAVHGHEASGSYRLQHARGEFIWVETVISPIHDGSGIVTQVRSSSRDVTQHKLFEDQLAHQTFHDPLTNLPNRALFSDRLKHALARIERRRTLVGVLFLDLNRFKLVNDSLGHAVGDQLLSAVGNRLQRLLRPGDTVARLGGDEFAVLLEDIVSVESAITVAQRVVEHFVAPFTIDRHEVYVSTSLGIAMGTKSTVSPDELIRNAGGAQSMAKQNGKPNYAVFDPALLADTFSHIELEADLRRAVMRGELRVHYQPLIQLDNGRIVEVEALVRWQHPQRGLLSPRQFIPLAEETGLIHPIGFWVLEQACAQAVAWRAQFRNNPPLVMAVNLSAKQLQQPGLVTAITDLLEATGLEPAGLKLELTETAVMNDPEAAAKMIQELRALGIRIAIDDFGTGYSSLSYIAHFLVDTLKIDRTFIARLGAGADSLTIIQTIMTLARSLNLTVTGEGVETPEQLGWLRELGCDRAQGFLFARPMPGPELVRLLGAPVN